MALRTNTRANFLSLAEDIHHLVLEELWNTSQSTLLSLTRVCRNLNVITTPYIYRSLTIAAPDNSRQQQSSSLIRRLLKEDMERFAQHIRYLRIEHTIDSISLSSILDKISNLKSFSWKVNKEIDPEILQQLTTKWPGLKLSVCNLNRVHFTSNGQNIDEAILSSPSLETLEYQMYTRYINSGGVRVPHSEWPQISSFLQAGGSCRFLHIDIGYVWTSEMPQVVSNPESRGPLALVFKEGSKVPPLEALCVTSSSGALLPFDKAQCALWRGGSLDWSRIKRLDFGHEYPLALFSEITGLVPNLRSLRFGLRVQNHELYDVSSETVTFLDSISSLEDLDIACLSLHVNTVWPAIRRHKDSLQKLILRPTYNQYNAEFTDCKYIHEVSQDFNKVTHFGVDAPMGMVSKTSHAPFLARVKDLFTKGLEQRFELDEAYIMALGGMKLSRLDLGIHLPEDETVFAPVYSPNVGGSALFPEMDIQGSRETSIALVETIFTSQRSLQTVNLKFYRMRYQDRFQGSYVVSDIQLQRSDRDDVDLLSNDKKWKVTGPCEWTSRWEEAQRY